ncbi:hypothetical protein HYDPIDRAFT_164766 [Hydnomerulius pinastri MD-312]|nr:hypothetical protein HYDPIDRAFT_164766 [Hydnomerulius pinastri MD-312]
MDISLAVREYIQNQVGQVLKEMETLDWSDWMHINPSSTTDGESRQVLKDKLVALYPGLLTGPHGSRLRVDSDWLPEYVVSAKISREKLKETSHSSDLDICNVVWRHEGLKTIALSFFNNHLDTSASFSTFVTPGSSTSRESLWAAGQNGTGFMIATQFFHDLIDKVREEVPSDARPSLGLSFRVDHDIGEVSRETAKCSSCPPRLLVTLDELSPITLSELRAKRGLTEHDAAMEVASMSRRRLAYKLSRPKYTVKNENTEQQGLFREEPMIESDEVVITIVGIPIDITPEMIFCGTFGLSKPSRSWKIPNALFEFFKTPADVPLFYYRGQLMPSSSTGLAQMGVNYHGTLEICHERTQVKNDHVLYQRYQHLLQEAIQFAFCHLPELAVEFACDMMAKCAPSSEPRNFEVFLPKTGHDAAYKSAFCAAWQKMGPEGPQVKPVYPYHESASEDLRLIEEFNMIGQPVPDKVMDQVIVPSGAFVPIKEHAEGIFLHRRGVGSGFIGFSQFRRAMLHVFSWAASSDIVMVDYEHSYPKVLWDDKTKQFVVGIPFCRLHPAEEECSCWVAPYLLEARNTYCKRSSNKDRNDVQGLSFGTFFRAYALAMGADQDQVDDKAKGPLARKRKTPPEPKASEKPEPPKRPRSEVQQKETTSSGKKDQDSDMEMESSPAPPSPPRAPRAPRADNQLTGAALRNSILVEPTLAPPTAPDSLDALSHPLSEYFKHIMDAYDRNSGTISTQAAHFEIQRQRLIADNVLNEDTISDLRAQVAEERAKAQCFRAQLQVVQIERDQTRDLLMAKWRQSKQ